MSSNKQPGLPTEVSYNEAVEASKKYFDGDVQPFHLFLSGIFKIYSICFYQRKCIKTYMPFCCDLIV